MLILVEKGVYLKGGKPVLTERTAGRRKGEKNH